MSREVGEAKLDLGGVCEERPEGLGYQQRSSSGQGCVEVSYPRARTVIWLRYLLGFSSSPPQLVWDWQALLLLSLLLLLFITRGKLDEGVMGRTLGDRWNRSFFLSSRDL